MKAMWRAVMDRFSLRCLILAGVPRSRRWKHSLVALGLWAWAHGVFAQTGSSDTPSVQAPDADLTNMPAEVVGVYFTPPADVAAAVMQVIDRSVKEVLVQAYGFTHQGIAQALVRAHTRGVVVKVLLDAKTDSTNRLVTDLLMGQGIAVKLDGNHAIAHNKVIVVDGEWVITGSFNFTHAAQTKNAENLLVLKSLSLGASYKKNWADHWAHSR